MGDWWANLVTEAGEIGQVVRECRRIAVLGIKPQSRAWFSAIALETAVARIRRSQGWIFV